MVKPLVIPIFIPHSGCPHQCVFCNQAAITEQMPGVPDRESIQETIHQYLAYKGKRKQVELAFFGGNFLGLDHEKILGMLELIQPFIQEKKIDGIRFSTRPDTITRATLDLIEPFPISAVELGVQSMNNKVLDLSCRGHSREDTISAVSLLKTGRYQIGVQLMTGLPGDNAASLMASTCDAVGLEPDFARIYPLLVLRGSPLEHQLARGEYQPLSLETSVVLVKKMVEIFHRHQIKVIRTGLQATDGLEDTSVVLAGPWHPAFGHLVFSSMMFDTACDSIDCCLKQSGPESGKTPVRLTLSVHPRSESRLRGDKGENLKQLHHRYPDFDIAISKDEGILPGQIRVEKA